jgi:hypothetical protein
MAALVKAGAKNADEIAMAGLKNLDLGAVGKNIDFGDITKNIDFGDITKNIDVGDITKNINKNIDVAALAKNADSLGDVAKNADFAALAKNADFAALAKNADSLGDVAKNADSLGDVAKNADSLGDAAKNSDTLTDIAKNTDSATGLGKEADTLAKNVDGLTDATKSFSGKALDNMKTIVKNNPGKTLGAVVLIGLGAAGVAIAMDEFSKNANKKVGIIKSYVNDTSFFDSLSSTEDIVIEFSPDAKIVDGDKVEISNTNFLPDINGKTYNVKEILSKSSIIITVPKISTFATKGNLTVKTSPENHMINTFKEGSEKTGKIVGKTVGTVVGSAIGATGGLGTGLLKGVLGEYYDYAIYVFYCIIFLIILGAIYKLYSLATAFS